MINRVRKQLGYIKRGAFGIIKNYYDQPTVSSGIPKFDIGYSVNSNPINVCKIGNGQQRILFVGGIHGNEVGGIKVAHHLIDWLSQSMHEYKNFTFYVIPCLNPDGYEQALKNPDYWNGGLIGRFNGNRVDLNRNFDTPSFQTESVWSRGKNYSEETTVHCGRTPLSEPETKALIDFINQEHIKTYIAFHNTAADVMGSNNEQGKRLAKIFSRTTNYKLITHEDWVTLKQTGTAKEWCDLNNITYLEIEGRDRWSSDWPTHQSGIKAVLQALDNNL